MSNLRAARMTSGRTSGETAVHEQIVDECAQISGFQLDCLHSNLQCAVIRNGIQTLCVVGDDFLFPSQNAVERCNKAFFEALFSPFIQLSSYRMQSIFALHQDTSLDEDKARRLCTALRIYTHGMASLQAMGLLGMPQQEAEDMMASAMKEIKARG